MTLNKSKIDFLAYAALLTYHSVLRDSLPNCISYCTAHF